MTIEQFIQQAREIESKSTEGPWLADYYHGKGFGPFFARFPKLIPALQRRRDAKFIAHAKNTYKPILDALTVAINNMESIDDEWPGELETRTDEEWKIIALVLMKGNRDSLAKIQTILEGAGE